MALQWSATDDSTYSLDVQTRDGTWITTRLEAGDVSSVTFDEVCMAATVQAANMIAGVSRRVLLVNMVVPIRLLRLGREPT